MSQARGTIPYRRDIDGLRALAVLPVVLYHAGLGCPGGYVGVDVFFVISGYLIGSLVIAEIRAGTFRMADFWERRVRRILPALAVTVIATVAVAAFVMVPPQFKDLGKSVLAQPFLLANVVFWRQSGYFDTAAELQPLLHTWSLAVEEQFYLLFPLAMIATAGRSLRAARICAALFFTASFAWCVFETDRASAAAFYLIFSRLWELDLGVLLALAPASRARPRLDAALSWLGLGMIAYAVLAFTVNTPFPGAAALVPCLGAALLIRSNSAATTAPGRLLGSAPLVFVGKISYSLYLWHWPAIVFVRLWFVSEADAPLLAATVAASGVLAWLSYRYVETPFRTKRLCAGRRPLFAGAAVAGVLFAGVGAVLYTSGGLPGRMPEEVRRHARERTHYESVDGIGAFLSTGAPPRFGHGSASAAEAAAEPAGELLLWGDSHAVSLLPLLDELGTRKRVVVHAAAQPEIAPIAGAHTPRRRRYRPGDAEAVLDFALGSGIGEVLLVARWSIYAVGGPDGDQRWRLADDSPDGQADPDEIFGRRLRETVERLEHAGLGVWVLREMVQHDHSVPEAVALAALRGRDLNSFAISAGLALGMRSATDALMDRALAGLPATVLDPLPLFFDESGRYLLAADGRALFVDRHHLSVWGTKRLEGLLEPVFDAAAARGPVGADGRQRP